MVWLWLVMAAAAGMVAVAVLDRLAIRLAVVRRWSLLRVGALIVAGLVGLAVFLAILAAGAALNGGVTLP